MGKFQRRLTITPHGTLLGWRKLSDRLEYSGQLWKSEHGVTINQYIPYFKFDFVIHYPALNKYWEEHYLGERGGVFITMYVRNQADIKTGILL